MEVPVSVLLPVREVEKRVLEFSRVLGRKSSSGEEPREMAALCPLMHPEWNLGGAWLLEEASMAASRRTAVRIVVKYIVCKGQFCSGLLSSLRIVVSSLKCGLNYAHSPHSP